MSKIKGITIQYNGFKYAGIVKSIHKKFPAVFVPSLDKSWTFSRIDRMEWLLKL